jgi:hypothetical protein
VVEVVFREPTPGRPVVALVGSGRGGTGWPEEGEGIQAVWASPEDLPSWSGAYRAVDALVLEVGALARLEMSQLRALEGHLGSCGRVLVVGASAAARARGSDRAGCGGRFFQAVDWEASLSGALAALLARSPEPLSVVSTLRARDEIPAAAGPLLGFALLYCAALVVAGASLRRSWAFPLIPLLASLLLLAGFRISRPEVSTLVWTQGISGAATARFEGRLLIQGMGPREIELELPRAAGLPTPAGAGQGTSIDSAEDDPSAIRMRSSTSLLSEQRLALGGAIAWSPPVRVETGGALPRVASRITGETRAGYLIWDDQVYALPSLAAGQEWTPERAKPLGASEMPRWLAVGGRGDGWPTVLLPGIPDPLGSLPGLSPLAGWISISAREAP